MSSEHFRKRRTSPFLVWPACIVLLLAFYVASLGPAIWMNERGWISQDSFNRMRTTVYFPMKYLANETEFYQETAVGRMYVSYLYWWSGVGGQ